MIAGKYTIPLKSLLASAEAKAAIDKALSTYPLYSTDKEYDLIPTREQLNRKLLNHYKYREIAFAAPGRFIDELEITMCEIMPYYNELLKTVVIMAELPNPFDNVDVVETFEQERKDISTGSGQTQANTTREETETDNTSSSVETYSKNIEADTPQGTVALSNKAIDGVDYASMAKWNKENQDADSERSGTSSGSENTTGTTSTESETTGTTTHTYTKKGNQGVNTYAHDMNEFRTSIIDVVEQIIADSRIQELFMMVY